MAETNAKPLSYAYDEEVYYNFFSVAFEHVNSTKKRVFIIFSDPRGIDDRSDLDALAKFVNNEVRTLVGYNNHNYDDVILKHLLSNVDMFRNESPKNICASCKVLSDKIITKQKFGKDLRDPYIDNMKRRRMFSSLDLLQTFNTVDRVGLKQIAINLKWPIIMDLPHKPSHIVMKEEIDNILFYNTNDSSITKALLHQRNQELQFRVQLTKELDMDLTSASDTMIGKTVLRKSYQEAMKVRYDDFKDKRTYSGEIRLKDCVSRKINFMTPEYMHVLNTIRAARINPNIKSDTKKEKQFEYIHKSKMYSHTVGLGGLHSISYPQIMTSCEEYEYIDVDVTSYYPYIIINDRIYPKHLGREFVDIYKEKIVHRRVKAKKDKLKVLADMLKIAANSTFGLTKSKFSWLYDPHVTTAICISGELYLLMLMERIEHFTSCVVVYANTDGMTVKVPKGQEQQFRSICQQWMEYTGFELEFMKFKKMIVYDVSNFIMITGDAQTPIKMKGLFNIQPKITQTVSFPVIAHALYEYFVNNVSPEHYIKTQVDPYQFMRSQRTSEDKYDIFFISKENPGERIMQQKTNRWIVTQGHAKEGKLIKYSLNRVKLNEHNGKLEDNNREEQYQKDKMVVLMNDMRLHTGDISTFKIDYDFYIQQTYAIIRKLKPRQQKKLSKHELQVKLF